MLSVGLCGLVGSIFVSLAESKVGKSDVVNIINLKGGIVDELVIARFHELVGEAEDLSIGEIAVPENDSFGILVDKSAKLGEEIFKSIELLELGDAFFGFSEMLFESVFITDGGVGLANLEKIINDREEAGNNGRSNKEEKWNANHGKKVAVGEAGTGEQGVESGKEDNADNTDDDGNSKENLRSAREGSLTGTFVWIGQLCGLVKAEIDAVGETEVIPPLIVDMLKAIFADKTEEIGFVGERRFVRDG